jgi:hypothetical protein
MDVQPTPRAPGPVDLVRMTAVSTGELALPTLSRHPRSRSRRPEAAGRAALP